MPPMALFDSWLLFPASVEVSAIHVRSSIKPLPLQDENWAKVNTTPKLSWGDWLIRLTLTLKVCAWYGKQMRELVAMTLAEILGVPSMGEWRRSVTEVRRISTNGY